MSIVDMYFSNEEEQISTKITKINNNRKKSLKSITTGKESHLNLCYIKLIKTTKRKGFFNASVSFYQFL